MDLMQELKSLKDHCRGDEGSGGDRANDNPIDTEESGNGGGVVSSNTNPHTEAIVGAWDYVDVDEVDPLQTDANRMDESNRLTGNESDSDESKTPTKPVLIRLTRNPTKAASKATRMKKKIEPCDKCNFRGRDRREAKEHSWTVHRIVLKEG